MWANESSLLLKASGSPGGEPELRQELVAAGERSEHLPQPPAWRAARPSVQGASSCPVCRPVAPRPGVRSTPPRRAGFRRCRHALSGWGAIPLVLFSPPDTALNLDPADPMDPGFPLTGHGSIDLSVLFNTPGDKE